MSVETLIFAGIRVGLNILLKRLGSKKLYVAILANRDIADDVKQYFGDIKGKKVQIVVNRVIKQMPLDDNAIEEIVRDFKKQIELNTRIGDTVVIVLACPLIYAIYIANALHHFSRKIIYTQFDLAEKAYRLYDFSHKNL